MPVTYPQLIYITIIIDEYRYSFICQGMKEIQKCDAYKNGFEKTFFTGNDELFIIIQKKQY
jgi:hypothetical protein